jgi:hypothetical protein
VEFRTEVSTTGYNAMLSRNIPALALFEALGETFGVHFKLEGKKIVVLP